MSGRESFDSMFDDGEDMTDYLDWDNAFHDELPDEPVTIAVRMEVSPSILVAIDKKAASKGKTRKAFFDDAIQTALSAV